MSQPDESDQVNFPPPSDNGLGLLPPPWAVKEQSACLVVRDGNDQQLAFVYFEDKPERHSAAKLLTRDEALRIVANIAKLSGLLKRG